MAVIGAKFTQKEYEEIHRFEEKHHLKHSDLIRKAIATYMLMQEAESISGALAKENDPQHLKGIALDIVKAFQKQGVTNQRIISAMDSIAEHVFVDHYQLNIEKANAELSSIRHSLSVFDSPRTLGRPIKPKKIKKPGKISPIGTKQKRVLED